MATIDERVSLHGEKITTYVFNGGLCENDKCSYTVKHVSISENQIVITLHLSNVTSSNDNMVYLPINRNLFTDTNYSLENGILKKKM